MSRTRIRLATAAVAVATAVAPAAAPAATKHGITPSSPKAGAALPAGEAVTFTGRVRGAGKVFLHVCRSRKVDAKGLICSKEVIAQARKADGRFSAKQSAFGFPEYWLNRRGTYYWQAHRIVCEGGDTTDCLQEGPVVRVRVR